MVILPPRRQWQRHENRLDATSRELEPEDCSSVVDQVELDVPPAPDLLPSLLAGGKLVVFVALREKGGREGAMKVKGANKILKNTNKYLHRTSQ